MDWLAPKKVCAGTNKNVKSQAVKDDMRQETDILGNI